VNPTNTRILQCRNPLKKSPHYHSNFLGLQHTPNGLSLEKYLDLIPVGDTDYRVWDLVIGDYKQPAKPKEKDSEEAALKRAQNMEGW